MKRLVLLRTEYTLDQTHGLLLVLDGHDLLYRCYTLELPWRNNMRNVSCVPTGTYRIVYEYSPRFKRHLWELKDVPVRSECKIHTANFVFQLNGCLSPGLSYKQLDHSGPIDITQSRKALHAIHEELQGLDETTISIYGQP